VNVDPTAVEEIGRVVEGIHGPERVIFGALFGLVALVVLLDKLGLLPRRDRDNGKLCYILQQMAETDKEILAELRKSNEHHLQMDNRLKNIERAADP